ncbi:MAG: hypothetical protein Q7N87_00285 [Candidatus Uhrbacteria bacterium]|nr:hypothetical protein [Candidatus Uhrbacteria bacterium]
MAETKRKIVTLNCGVEGCCPEVEFIENGEIEIRDDCGGKVKLTKAQWDHLQRIDTEKVVTTP